MASRSGCSRPIKELGLLDTLRAMGASASEIDHVAMSSLGSPAELESVLEVKSEDVSVEEQIERSKVHWSMLTNFGGEKGEPLQRWKKWQKFMSCCSNVEDEEVVQVSNVVNIEDEEVAEVSNVEEFLALQRDPTWGGFFQIFNYKLGDMYDPLGELVVGKKFAEGGQAELFDAKVKWWLPEKNDEDVRYRREYALKIFKKGTFLKHLKSQLPQGLMQMHVEELKNLESPTPIKLPRFQCQVLRGTLLKDGRFAILMEKEHFDLRHLIDKNMKLKSGKDCGPFSKDEVELIMYLVALGVERLHNQGIVHRDLKASNVLVWEYKRDWPKWGCFVADYECSVGVVGTGFFRAPEILQACKDRKLRERSEVFSKAADIYGYGMICYEVLTGKLPFDGRRQNDYNHVLRGEQPFVPKHVEDWIHELLKKCWQTDPTARPCIGDILRLILAHSTEARRNEDRLERGYGKNWRLGYHALREDI